MWRSSSLRLTLAAGLLLAAAPPAWAADAGTCLVLSARGEVSVEGRGAGGPLEPFRPLADGDTIVLGAGGELEIACVGSATLTRWTGPARLVAGGGGVRAEGGTAPAAVALSDGDLGELRDVAALVSCATADVAAEATVRQSAPREAPLGLEEESELVGARTRYAKRTAAADPRDIGPEMRLAASLIGLEQYEEACKVLQTAEAKCSGCGAARSLRAYAERRAPSCGRAGKEKR